MGAHRRRLVLRPGAGTPLDRGAARARASRPTCPGLVAPMLPHELADDALLAPPAPGPALRHRRAAAGRRAALLPLGDPLATRGSPTARPSGGGAAGDPRAARAERRARDRRCARARFARGALAGADARARVPVRRRGGVADAWLEGEPHAHMLVEELMILANEHVGGVPRRRATARRSTACTSGPTRRRSSSCSRSSPTSACRRRRRRSVLTPQAAAALAGRRSRERVAEYVAAVGPRARGVSGARPARAQAGAVRPAQPRPLRPREPGLLPLHLADPPLPRPRRPPRAAARARRSATTRCAGRPRSSSPSTPPSASARRRRSSTWPTRSASPGCSSDRLLERGWDEPWEGEIIGADRLRASSSASARCSRASCRRGGCRASSSS